MKAVVMETRKKEAAILLKDGTFRIVKGKYTVGETIDFHEKVPPPPIPATCCGSRSCCGSRNRRRNNV